MRLELLGNGTDSVSAPILIGMDVVEISIDGIGRSKILTSGIPIDQEVVFDSTNGSITFAEIFNNDTQIFVLYQNA
jgi:hypothetical protein